jgi:hypothetical protein
MIQVNVVTSSISPYPSHVVRMFKSEAAGMLKKAYPDLIRELNRNIAGETHSSTHISPVLCKIMAPLLYRRVYRCYLFVLEHFTSLPHSVCPCFLYAVLYAAIRRIQQRKHELLGYAISLFVALCIGIANFLSRLAWRVLDLYDDAANSAQLEVQQASTIDRLLRDNTATPFGPSPFGSMPFDASIAGGSAGVALLPKMFQQFTKKIVELETMNAQYLQHQESLLRQVSEMNTKLEKLDETNAKLEKLGATSIETNAKLGKLGETNAKLEKLGEASTETNVKLEKLGETSIDTNAKLEKLGTQLEELRLQQHGLSCPQTAGGWCDGT